MVLESAIAGRQGKKERDVTKDAVFSPVHILWGSTTAPVKKSRLVLQTQTMVRS